MSASPPPTPPAPEPIAVTIDGRTHRFAPGTSLLDACNQVGANVPYFCYHPGLSAPAQCRQCLVEIQGQPKPIPSCCTPVADKMEVSTASQKILDVRRQMLEFTLLNHPIDCPICDKAGECTLQELYVDWDAKYARNDGIKVRKAKAVDIGPRVVLDQERCILCSRCVRVCGEVARSPDLTFADRGDRQVLTTAPGRLLDNPYSLNTVDVCPVGALTSKDFRFAMRVWELHATPSVCPGCATGCNIEVHASRGQIYRLVPRENPEINRFWMCDEGRLTYKRIRQDRLAAPICHGVPVVWDRALADAAAKLRAVIDRNPGAVAVVLSAQSTNEDLHAAARLCFEHLGITQAFLAAQPAGSEDSILVSADKNPNTAGARAVGGARLRPAAELGPALHSGAVQGLLVIGDGLVLDEGARTALGKLEALVVLAAHVSPLTDAAHAALPLADWAETDGSFTNRQGIVQRIRAAVAPAGDSLPGWEILSHLGRKLGAAVEFESARAVFADARQKLDFMKDADWGRPHLPVQLRFAGSRG